MIRLFIVILLTLSFPFSAFAQGSRPLNEVSIVALIITSGDETQVSASVTETLESLDAQTLTANSPNASEMRSILKRFTAAAIDTDVALVYYDGAVLRIGDREFVAPGGIELRRPSDLLTKAIPLSALARATALALNGGAVLVHSTGQNISLIDGITLVEAAPSARNGTSPILFASASAAESLADGLGAMVETEENIDLLVALNGLSNLEGVSISQLPSGSTMLRQITPPAAVDTMAAEMTQDESATTTGDETAVAATTEETGMALPQVTQVEESFAASVAETAETLESAATDAVEETADTTTEAMADATETVATEDTTEAETVITEDVDSELSIEVLRAMQGALTRSQKRVVQRSLRNLGFYRGLIDGIFGRQTERAISAYQESINVEVTGIMTPTQLRSLSQ